MDIDTVTDDNHHSSPEISPQTPGIDPNPRPLRDASRFTSLEIDSLLPPIVGAVTRTRPFRAMFSPSPSMSLSSEEAGSQASHEPDPRMDKFLSPSRPTLSSLPPSQPTESSRSTLTLPRIDTRSPPIRPSPMSSGTGLSTGFGLEAFRLGSPPSRPRPQPLLDADSQAHSLPSIKLQKQDGVQSQNRHIPHLSMDQRAQHRHHQQQSRSPGSSLERLQHQRLASLPSFFGNQHVRDKEGLYPTPVSLVPKVQPPVLSQGTQPVLVHHKNSSTDSRTIAHSPRDTAERHGPESGHIQRSIVSESRSHVLERTHGHPVIVSDHRRQPSSEERFVHPRYQAPPPPPPPAFRLPASTQESHVQNYAGRQPISRPRLQIHPYAPPMNVMDPRYYSAGGLSARPQQYPTHSHSHSHSHSLSQTYSHSHPPGPIHTHAQAQAQVIGIGLTHTHVHGQGIPHGTVPYSQEGLFVSPSSMNGISPGGFKAPRKRADDMQLAVLNEAFERTAYPSTEERDVLAKKLGMTSRSVQIWFQNRRRAIKVDAQSAVQRAEAEVQAQIAIRGEHPLFPSGSGIASGSGSGTGGGPYPSRRAEADAGPMIIDVGETTDAGGDVERNQGRVRKSSDELVSIVDNQHDHHHDQHPPQSGYQHVWSWRKEVPHSSMDQATRSEQLGRDMRMSYGLNVPPNQIEDGNEARMRLEREVKREVLSPET